jgi:hypothetical protein
MTSMMMTAMVMTDSAGTRVVMNGGQIITAGGRCYFKTPKKLEKGTGSQ